MGTIHQYKWKNMGNWACPEATCLALWVCASPQPTICFSHLLKPEGKKKQLVTSRARACCARQVPNTASQRGLAQSCSSTGFIQNHVVYRKPMKHSPFMPLSQQTAVATPAMPAQPLHPALSQDSVALHQGAPSRSAQPEAEQYLQPLGNS